MTGALTGLVPSINNAETRSAFFPERIDAITIDKVQARCTRLRKNLGISAKWLSGGGGQCWMLTFTYAKVDDWKPCHLREAITNLRKWALRAFKWRLRYP